MEIRSIAPDDDALVELVSTSSTSRLQHTPTYLRFLERISGDPITTIAAFDGPRVVAALSYAVRSGPFGKLWNSLPHPAGYGGVVIADGAASAAAALLERAMSEAREQGCVAATICTPPHGVPADWYGRVTAPTVALANFFQYQSLDQHPLETLAPKRRRAFRNELKKAKDAGIELVRQSEQDLFEAWYENVYVPRFQAIGANPIGRSFLKGLVDTFCPGSCDVVYARREGRIVAGTVFTYFNGVVDYYSTAATEEGAGAFAPALIIDSFIRWIIESKRATWLNWQSSPSRGGVHAFKARWGAQEGEHHYLSYALGNIEPLLETPLSTLRTYYPGYFIWPRTSPSAQEPALQTPVAE